MLKKGVRKNILWTHEVRTKKTKTYLPMRINIRSRSIFRFLILLQWYHKLDSGVKNPDRDPASRGIASSEQGGLKIKILRKQEYLLRFLPNCGITKISIIKGE